MDKIERTVIDMGEVVYYTDPQTILEVRSAMNGVINSQNQLMMWLTARVAIDRLEEEEKQQYHILLGSALNALLEMTTAMAKEDQVVGEDTAHLR